MTGGQKWPNSMSEEYREHRRKQMSSFSLIDSIFPIVNLKKDFEVNDSIY